VNDDNQAIVHLPLAAEDSDAVHLELHSGDTRQILIKLGDGVTVTIQDDDPVLIVEVDGGKAAVQIDRDGAVTIGSQGDLTVSGTNVTIEAQGDLNLTASGNANIQGATVNLN
jgi:hypothetical protein